MTKRVDGLLRAIEQGKVKEYHDKQDKIKCRRRFGKNEGINRRKI